MGTTEFFQEFKIDRSSKIPLKTQLEQALEAAFARLEPGSTIPPERQIAEFLQISRVTVRSALQTFYNRGIIVRYRRLGTRIAERKQAEFNPLSLGPVFAETADYSLKILLYENLPPQKKFWTETVESFNANNPEFPVEIIWMTSGSDALHVQEIIEEKSIDILQDSIQFDLDRKNLYHRLSESFREQLSSDEYLFKMFPETLEYTLPVGIGTPMLFQNCELTKKCGFKNVSDILRDGKLADLSAQAVLKLPDDTFACGRIWDYFSFTALPEAADSAEQLHRILRGIADAGKKGKYSENLFMTAQKSIMEHVELFLRGKVLFLPAPMTFLQAFNEPSFAYEVFPFPKARASKILADYNVLAIVKGCMDTRVAERFLLHVISPEIQKKCAEIKKMIPIRKKECIDMLSSAYEYSDREAKEFLASLQFHSYEKDALLPSFARFCTFFVRNELTEVFRGQLSPDAATKIIGSKWQRFQKNTSQKKEKDTK